MVHALLRQLRRAGAGLPSCRPASTTAAQELLPLAFPAVAVWGSNTGVGKTLFSAGLAAACLRAGFSPLYVKPVQTGFPTDSDSRLVAAAQGALDSSGPHAAVLNKEGASTSSAAPGAASLGRYRTLFAWSQPVSPHLAVELEGRPVSDAALQAAVLAELNAPAVAHPSALDTKPFALVETAGGVASPGPSGTLQCDLLRPLRLPGMLVGDGRLGGISATLAAWETLMLRGHDLPAVALMDRGLGNTAAISRHLKRRSKVVTFPVCKPPVVVGASGGVDAQLQAWLAETQAAFDELLGALTDHHQDRVGALQAAAGSAREVLWWPFTQHGTLGEGDVSVMEARCGEHFSVFREGTASSSSSSSSGSSGSFAIEPPERPAALQKQYDGCASWWTQGVNEAAQPALARAVGHAAARYGHIIFPQNVHLPALQLAQRLLSGVGAGWAARVFFTDNGSTAVEVALKMAFRKYMVDHALLEPTGPQLHVLGLQEAYHGDTLGTMDAVAPSTFNGRLQTPWYSGRGLFLDPPSVALIQGEWRVHLTAALGQVSGNVAADLSLGRDTEGVFHPARAATALAKVYRQHVEAAMEAHLAVHDGVQLGACILEPVVQGAGGMRLVDPLFQRTMAEACRARRVPVIFDEVFTGFWRLGAPTAASLLGVHPDIACYAKLLTGGLVPMAVTLASDAVFQSFAGDSKAYALLHGHSYTAHPLGCSAALEALDSFTDSDLNPNVCTPHAPGRCRRDSSGTGTSSACIQPCGNMLPMWNATRVAALSSHPRVARVLALGTVLAAELHSENAGYASDAAAAVVRGLRQRGVYARPLGNVVYLMVTPMTARQQCDSLLDALEGALGAADQNQH